MSVSIETATKCHCCGREIQSLPARLTDAETEVMVRLIDGKTTHAIAAELGRSGHTISTHAQRAKKKLGAKSIMQAAVIFALGTR